MDTAPPPGTGEELRTQHRHTRRVPTRAIAAAVAVAAAAALVGTSVVLERAGADGCARNGQKLTVVVAQEIAQAVSEVAALCRGAGAGLRVTVVGRPSAASADAVMSGKDGRPDVWIPDSSIWVRRVAAAGVKMPADNPPVALSPVVLALSRQAAAQLGWPGRALDLAQLVGSDSARPVRLGLPDPERWSASIGALHATQAAVAGQGDGRSRLATAMRAATTELPGDPLTLLDAGGDTPVAVAVTEQAVALHHLRGHGTDAVAAYTPGMTLDYPFVVTSADESTRKAANQLLDALHQRPGRDRLLANGFRDAQGNGGKAITGSAGLDGSAPAKPALPSVAEVDEALRTFQLARLGSRALAVIDISGSMGEPVPGAGGKTRLDLATEAAALGLAEFPDDSEIGLWVFSTDIAPGTDYRELVPTGPLGVQSDGETGRARLARALGGVRPIPNGATGLYDTALAAVRKARDGWRAGRVNSVILLTDGRNEDDNGISLPELLTTLQRENDSSRPVPVITIGYGPDSDAEALAAISDATAGARYLAPDTRQINDIFQDAVGQRFCRPHC